MWANKEPTWNTTFHFAFPSQISQKELWGNAQNIFGELWRNWSGIFEEIVKKFWEFYRYFEKIAGNYRSSSCKTRLKEGQKVGEYKFPKKYIKLWKIFEKYWKFWEFRRNLRTIFKIKRGVKFDEILRKFDEILKEIWEKLGETFQNILRLCGNFKRNLWDIFEEKNKLQQELKKNSSIHIYDMNSFLNYVFHARLARFE